MNGQPVKTYHGQFTVLAESLSDSLVYLKVTLSGSTGPTKEFSARLMHMQVADGGESVTFTLHTPEQSLAAILKSLE